MNNSRRVIRIVNALDIAYEVDCQDKPESIPGFGSPGKCSLGRFSLIWLLEVICREYDFFEGGSPATRLRHNGESSILLWQKTNGKRVMYKREDEPYPVWNIKWHDIVDTSTPDGPMRIYTRFSIHDFMHAMVVLLANDLEVLSDNDVKEKAACPGILSGTGYDSTSHLTHNPADVNPFTYCFEENESNSSRGDTCTMCKPCLHSPRCLKQCRSGCVLCIHDEHAKSGDSLTERMRAKFIDELGVEDNKNKLTFWLCLEFLFPGVKFTRTPTRGGTHVSMDFQDVDYMKFGFYTTNCRVPTWSICCPLVELDQNPHKDGESDALMMH